MAKKKKWAMLVIWRISQAGPILSIFFWSTTLAGIFWPILGKEATATSPAGPLLWFVTDVLGVGGDRATLVGLLLLFFGFVFVIILIGWLYDRVFKLWREQMDVIYERNPYADDLLFRKEILQWKQYYLPLAKAVYKVSPDPDLKVAIERVESWIATGRIQSEDHT